MRNTYFQEHESEKKFPVVKGTISSTAKECGSHENPGLPLFLQRTPESCGKPLHIQRDGQALPAVPDVRLTPPSLLQPRIPVPRLLPNLTFRLDPEIQRMMFEVILSELSPERLRAAVSRIDLGAVDQPSPGPAILSVSLPHPSSQPAFPVGAGPSAPRAASAGDFLGAFMAIPQVSNLGTYVVDRLSSDWGRVSTADRLGVITWSTLIAGGALAGILTDPGARSFALERLNGRVVPVPGIDFLRLEIHTGEESLMLGAHVDVGWLLHRYAPMLGFEGGAGTAIGGPPRPEPFMPGIPRVARKADGVVEGAEPDIASRIRAVSGQGNPVEAPLRKKIERPLGADLSNVSIHTDSEADRLSRAVGARAFTAGQDIFFRSGQCDPNSEEGRRLIAHEAVHTVQQAAGPVAGTPVTSEIAISTPGDADEQKADSLADQIT